jgi:hypothetical protein
MSLSSAEPGVRDPLSTKQGWASFAAQTPPEPPRLLPVTDWQRLDGLERQLYDEARQDYHCQLLLVATPDIRRIIHHGSKLVIHNRGKQLGRRGLLVSGASGTGKSTSITQLGKTFQIDLQRRWPANPDRIPVVYIACSRPTRAPKRWPPNWRRFGACRSTPMTGPNTSPIRLICKGELASTYRRSS